MMRNLRNYQYVFYFIFSIFLLSCRHNSIQQYWPVGAEYSAKAKNDYMEGILKYDDTLFANIGKNKFAVLCANGQINETNGKEIISEYHLELPEDQYIRSAYLAYYKDELLVYFECADAESGSSYLNVFNKTNKKMVFEVSLDGFNLGLPVIKDSFTYVSSIGFIGKINLNTGQYAWKYDTLYDNKNYLFNAFDSIIIKNNTIIFVSSHDLPVNSKVPIEERKLIKDPVSDSIIVYEISGNIIREVTDGMSR